MPPPPHDAAAAWRAARNLQELCELGARFCEGTLERFPGWGAPTLDAESLPIAPQLAALNRAGLLTLASQPGAPDHPGPDGRLRCQRAFVAGFATDAVARHLGELALATDVVVVVLRAGEEGGYPFPVGTHAGRPDCFTGYDARADELALFADDCGAEGLAALERAAYACVLDPVWGRRGHLWTALLGTLRADGAA